VNRRLTGEGSEKDTRHYEISLHGSGLTYEAGDALGIMPTNSPELVDEILKALQFDGEEEVGSPEGDKMPIRLALLREYQIRAPHLEFLSAMAEHDAADQYLKELINTDIRTELDKFLWGREIIDFLLESPGVKFAPEEFVFLLKKLQPRLYSIASSLKAHPEEVHLTVDTVRYEIHGRKRRGVCSNFLAERAGKETPVPVFIQVSKHFRVPENGDRPIIMVGPGTGIAPFSRLPGGAKVHWRQRRELALFRGTKIKLRFLLPRGAGSLPGRGCSDTVRYGLFTRSRLQNICSNPDDRERQGALELARARGTFLCLR
jgi:sulfite reductase (NADPH) flavoprotein alpha-component